MIVDLLRKGLSYFWDIQIDYRHSEINGDLVVFLVKGRYQLCTAHAIYSFEDHYDNFGNIFRDYLELGKLPGNNVLVLGLGLGSIPIILDQIEPEKWNFTAVEIDTEVCELASMYGYPKIKSYIQTVVADASVFIKSCEEQFDLICIDLFIDEEIPQSCLTVEFLKDLKNCLNPKGLVLANTLAFKEKHRTFSKSYFRDVFSKAFPKALKIYTHKNFMLISDSEYLQ